MTTPDDPTGPMPNVLSQPGAAPPTEPGWAAVPPPQPGWGAPPPGYQPGWGAPPPQPGWGAPSPNTQPNWGQPGWTAQPQPTSHTKRNGCLIGCGAAAVVGVVLIVVLIVSAAQLLLPALDVSSKIQQNSHGQVSNISYQWNNGVGDFRISLAPGVSDSQARDVACNVVRPTLKGTKFEGTNFEIFGNDGLIAADETTPCG